MSDLHGVGAWIQDRLPELLVENQVPAAAVAVAVGGEVVEAAAGVLHKGTGVTATVDSGFQIGSITKVWTATLAMQLVDEGKLFLDEPVRSYVPEFVIADEKAAASVTVRQLLCHMGGFEGDVFTDTGRGDDCVAKYVASLGELPQLFPPGQMFSYNNAGYCVLGRLIEVLRGKSYDQCLQEHLLEPLNLQHAAPSPWEAILHRSAIGHIQPSPDAEPVPAPLWALARSNGPAGSMLAMQARDLVTFGQMHLNNGVGADGRRILSQESAKGMRERQVELPGLARFGDAWGIGWEIFDADGGTVFGHDGSTLGQDAFLRVVPGSDLVVTVLTNGGNPMALFHEIGGRVLRDLAGIQLPQPEPHRTGAGSTPPDLARILGTYSSALVDSKVRQDEEGRIWLESVPQGFAAEMGMTARRSELLPWSDNALINAVPDHGAHTLYRFLGDDGDGHALYLHTGRASRRSATEGPADDYR